MNLMKERNEAVTEAGRLKSQAAALELVLQNRELLRDQVNIAEALQSLRDDLTLRLDNIQAMMPPPLPGMGMLGMPPPMPFVGFPPPPAAVDADGPPLGFVGFPPPPAAVDTDGPPMGFVGFPPPPAAVDADAPRPSRAPHLPPLGAFPLPHWQPGPAGVWWAQAALEDA